MQAGVRQRWVAAVAIFVLIIALMMLVRYYRQQIAPPPLPSHDVGPPQFLPQGQQPSLTR